MFILSLPIGGREQIIATYKIKDDLLEFGTTGGTSLSPLKSGMSYLELCPFYRSRQIDGDDVNEKVKTNGLDFSVFWANRDFYANRSRGFGLRGKLPRDFGWLNNSSSWTNVEGEFGCYIPFEWGNWMRQGVIALDY